MLSLIETITGFAAIMLMLSLLVKTLSLYPERYQNDILTGRQLKNNLQSTSSQPLRTVVTRGSNSLGYITPTSSECEEPRAIVSVSDECLVHGWPPCSNLSAYYSSLGRLRQQQQRFGGLSNGHIRHAIFSVEQCPN